jgi:hypothetical protein
MPSALARLRRFYLLNPIGSNLMMGPVLFLLALDYGAGDFAMGVLYAGIYLAGSIAPFAPMLCARIDPARLAEYAWVSRAICGIPYVTLPFIPGKTAKIAVLVIASLSFAVARMIGVIALNVITASYAKASERPRLLAYAHVWYNVGVLSSTVFSTVLLFWCPGQMGYLSVILIGIIITFATTRVLRALPAVGKRQEHVFPLPWKDRGVREAMRTTALIVPQVVAAAYQLSALKKAHSINSGTIFTLTVIGIFLAILATRWLTSAMPRYGLKRVQIAIHAGLVVVGLAWAFAGGIPLGYQGLYCMALYVASQPLLGMSLALMSVIQADRLPVQGVVGASAIIQASGAIGGILGILIIFLASKCGFEQLWCAGAYVHAFLIWVACSLAICIMGLLAGLPPGSENELSRVNASE